MKISVQEKIAELESRIVALERGPAWASMNQAMHGAETQKTVTTKTVTTVSGPAFGEHWNKMWDEFHLMMKDVFK